MEVDERHSGPLHRNGEDRDECICMDEEGGSQGDTVTLHMIEHRAAHGCCEEMGDEIEGVQVVSCSCTLTPVHVNGNKMHGAVSLTHLVPHLLQSNMPCLSDDSQLPISASVKQLRHAFLLLQSPKQFFHQAPG